MDQDLRDLAGAGVTLLVHGVVMVAAYTAMPPLPAEDEDGVSADQLYLLQVSFEDRFEREPAPVYRMPLPSTPELGPACDDPDSLDCAREVWWIGAPTLPPRPQGGWSCDLPAEILACFPDTPSPGRPPPRFADTLFAPPSRPRAHRPRATVGPVKIRGAFFVQIEGAAPGILVGGRAADGAIEAEVRESADRFRLCYERALQDDAGSAGSVEVSLTWQGPGSEPEARAAVRGVDAAVACCVRLAQGNVIGRVGAGVGSVRYTVTLR